MPVRAPIDAVLFDLLMAVMDSPATWAAAAGSRRLGLAWRDAATSRMRAAPRYLPYGDIVEDAAADAGVDPDGRDRLFRAWSRMRPRPDAAALASLGLPYAFVTNCSRSLADAAARRSGLAPRFVLAAEEAGMFKPAPGIYREACRRMGTRPGRTAFVAGSPYDAAGARAAGLCTWLVERQGGNEAPAGVQLAGSLGDVVVALQGPAPQRF